MRIYLKKGSKTENDNIIYVDSNSNDYINLMDLAFLINQFAINELNVMKDKNLDKNKNFWFENLINISLEDAKKGINWKNLGKEKFLFLKEYPFFVPEKTIDKFFENLKDD